MAGTLERNSCAELNLPPRSGGFGDGAELRRIDEAVWRTEIDIVQSVEKLCAELEPKSFTQSELAHDCHVECLQSRSVERISPHISKREGRRCCESRWTKLLGGGVGARPEDGLARGVGTNWVLAKNRARVGRVAKHRNGKRKPGLRLIHSRQLPVASQCPDEWRALHLRDLIDCAEREPVADVASGALLRGKIAVVLRD